MGAVRLHCQTIAGHTGFPVNLSQTTGGFPLIRDAYRRNVRGGKARLCHGPPGDLKRRLPNLQRVVFHPSPAWGSAGETPSAPQSA